MSLALARRGRPDVLLAAAVALGSCASGSMTRIGAPAAPKPPNCQFDVYMSEQEVRVPNRTVCMLEGTSGSTIVHDRTINGALAQLRPKICQCGADGVVLVNANTTAWNGMTYGHGAVVAKGILYASSEAGYGPPPPQGYAPGPAPGAPPPAYGPPAAPGGYPPPPAGYPPPGYERGPCFGNGACMQGLVCAQGYCVRPR